MGIRSIERRLAPELCYEAVAEAVHAYVEESRQAGRLLWPHEHLVVPIIRAGYYPPGLLSVKHFISRRQQEMARPQGRDAGTGVGEIGWRDEDSIIEEIMWPYPTARLRARRRREASRSFDQQQAEQWRRKDATKCKTMQQKRAEARTSTVTDDGATADSAVQHAPESPCEDAMKCNTLQQNAAISDPAAKSAGTRRERALPPDVARGLEEMGKRMHFEPLGDHRYRVTIDPHPSALAGKSDMPDRQLLANRMATARVMELVGSPDKQQKTRLPTVTDDGANDDARESDARPEPEWACAPEAAVDALSQGKP